MICHPFWEKRNSKAPQVTGSWFVFMTNHLCNSKWRENYLSNAAAAIPWSLTGYTNHFQMGRLNKLEWKLPSDSIDSNINLKYLCGETVTLGKNVPRYWKQKWPIAMQNTVERLYVRAHPASIGRRQLHRGTREKKLVLFSWNQNYAIITSPSQATTNRIMGCHKFFWHMAHNNRSLMLINMPTIRTRKKWINKHNFCCTLLNSLAVGSIAVVSPSHSHIGLAWWLLASLGSRTACSFLSVIHTQSE